MAHITEREHEGLRMSHLDFKADKALKTPAKALRTPLAPGRKAFSAFNSRLATPVVKVQEKKPIKVQEAKVEPLPQMKEEYPEIEKFFPYDPLEFEKYGMPEDVVTFGDLVLAGGLLPQSPYRPEEDDMAPEPMSPMRLSQGSGGQAELDAFMQTLEELTVELPELED
ncbi:securin isoform X2 [Nerophis ophidion]|uniref:securin isoform X2 n=1 Tax=Nerophis ophidion TaxID=159077 RepID=UPI002ADF2C75|nr:securin isoform X2 [Nerophis ophidion]